MIQFHRTIGKFNGTQPVALDAAALHVVDRHSRAPLTGYDYSLRAIPLPAITRVDVVRETRAERIWAGLLVTAGSLCLGAILIASLNAGRVYLSPLFWLCALLGIPGGIWLCFNRRQTTVTFVVEGRKFALPLSDRTWKKYKQPILEILKRGGVRTEIYGWSPTHTDEEISRH